VSLAGHVSVWLTHVSAVVADLGGDCPSWLSDQELSRYQIITAAKRRVQFVAGRCWARQCLALAAGGPWQDYMLSAPDHGAPVVLDAPHAAGRALFFSISHSGDWLVCAVAQYPVGVDIENTQRGRDTQALGEWIHGPQERTWVHALSTSARHARFYELWCLKEAWLKQVAAPLRTTMQGVQFMPADDSDAQAVIVSAEAFTLAVFPATPSSVVLHGAELEALPKVPWKTL